MIAAIWARVRDGGWARGVALQTMFLFGVDLLTNGVDYLFHVYLGRALVPGDFAVFQTINSLLIVVITAFGVFQPVVARAVAGEGGGGEEEKRRGGEGARRIFGAYFRWGSWVGGILAGVVLIFRNGFAAWFNVPPGAVAISSGVVLLAFSRPVVWGMLQGQERFVAFGLTRLTYAVSRFAVAAGLIALGWTVLGAVTALPVGMVLSWGLGLVVLWPALTPGPSPIGRGESFSPSPRGRGGWGVRAGLGLAGWAFVAYAAHTALLNLDMLWVNRMFSPDEAGAYAGAVLLRRILLLLPGVIVVVFYPRVVAGIARRELPDRLLLISMGTVGGAVLLFTGLYFVAGDWLVRLVFGEAYALAGPWLGWMGLGILGYSLGTIWMNLALATRPGGFVGWLGLVVAAQMVGLGVWAGTLPRVVGVFTVTGWALALGGAVWYGAGIRPRLFNQFQQMSANK